MPPARKAKAAPTASTLGGLVDDSDQEDDLSSMSVTRLQSKPVTKKKTTVKTKAKPKASVDATEPENLASKKRVRLTTTAAAASPVIPGGKTSSKKPTAKPSRPLGSRITQVLENEDIAEATPTVRPTPKSTTNIKRKKATGDLSDEDEDMADAPQDHAEKPKAKKGRIVKVASRKAVPEAEPMDEPMDELEPPKKLRVRIVKKAKAVPEPEEIEEDEQVEQEPAAPEQPPTPPPASRILPASVLRTKKRVVVPNSSQLVLSDPTANQKLADMKLKYENLEAKYNSLREVGIQEAQNNYDKLKKQSEERAKTSTELIQKLKEEVAHQTELAEEGEALRIELTESEATIDELQAKLASLEKLLTESRAENKNLATKLAASRAGDSINGIGSISNGTRAMGANEIAQMAHMKEDLYGDLTGLYIRGVKRTDGEDVFDCLLSVRNWTLHFKLATDQEDGNGSGEYQEAMFTYRPQLDENRDKALIELLPEYLTDEIQFARPHSSRFYARVTQALSADKS